MSDLLASVLAIVQDEVDAFWCFVGLMEGSVFVTSPKDDVMDRQLVSYNVFFQKISTPSPQKIFLLFCSPTPSEIPV